MSSVRVLPLIVEVRDQAAWRASKRLAWGAMGLLSMILVVPLVLFAEQPRLYLPKARALVINMRYEVPEQPVQRAESSERRRLLADSSPISAPQLEKKPDPPKVTQPEPAKVVEKKPEPKPKPKPRPKPRSRKKERQRTAPSPSMMTQSVAIGKGKPQAGVVGGATDGARVEVSAASRQKALAVLMEAIEKNKRYPRQARRAGAQGTVTLRIRIAENGHVRQATVAKNCGIGSLDLESARLAERLKGLDTGVTGAGFTVVVPVKYQLKRG